MKLIMIALTAIASYVIACHPRAQSGNSVLASNTTAVGIDSTLQDPLQLDGSWILNDIKGAKLPFKSLYANKIPFIKFNSSTKTVNGNTSCNSFSGSTKLEGNKIQFQEPMAVTQRFCPGDGESLFLGNLSRVKSFKVKADSLLELYSGDTLLLKFSKSITVQ